MLILISMCVGADNKPTNALRRCPLGKTEKKQHEVLLPSRHKSQRLLDRKKVRTMHELSNYEIAKLVVAREPRIPFRAIRTIIDADIKRQRARNTTAKRVTSDDTSLLRRLTKIREPGRELFTDPLYWYLRVREIHRAATLAYHRFQHGEELFIEPFIKTQRITPTSVSYRTMAARACLTIGITSADHKICNEILIQRQRGDNIRVLQNRTSRHWFIWASSRHKISREEAIKIGIRSGIFGNGWTLLSDG